MAIYCQTLEEKAFWGRTADFFYMILFGATVMTSIVVVGSMIPYVSGSFVGIYFLSHSLIFMMVYVWSKYNPSMLISFFGLFNYSSTYLPWIVPKNDGPLRTPSFIKAWFAEDEAVVQPAADPRFAPAPQEDVIIDE